MNKKICSLFSILLLITRGFAQLPDSDIYLYEVKKKGHTLMLHKGENVTKRSGYDNQPFFMPDNKSFIYVSIQAEGQADVYRYELRSKKSVQVCHTTQSEYSPVLCPDGKHLSVVMVEKDSTQRIWQMNTDGTGSTVLTEREDSIGYYCWLNKDSILFYKLSNPHSLHAYSLSQQKDTWLADNITRSFKPCDKYSFFYVLKEKDRNLIMRYDTRLKKATVYATAKPDNEDFIWDKELGLIKSEGSKLLRWQPELKTWVEVAEFSGAGIGKITRFTFSANGHYLAIVGNK